MVTVRVIKSYRDAEKMVLFHIGDTHEVSEARAKKLINAGVCEIAEEKESAEEHSEGEENEQDTEQNSEADETAGKTKKKNK